jgi:hypothetical protein
MPPNSRHFNCHFSCVRSAWKAPICLAKSVRPFVSPSVRIYQCGSHWTHFRAIWYQGLLRKSVLKIKISLPIGQDYRARIWRHKYDLLLPGHEFAKKHCCATKHIFILLSVTCSCIYTDINSCFQLRKKKRNTRKRDSVTFNVHCQSCNISLSLATRLFRSGFLMNVLWIFYLLQGLHVPASRHPQKKHVVKIKNRAACILAMLPILVLLHLPQVRS